MESQINYLRLAEKSLAYQQVSVKNPPRTHDSGNLAQSQQKLEPTVHLNAGAKPGLLFLSGYGSDMSGTKASFLAEQAVQRGWNFTRFDYRGHGQSSGVFKEHTLGDWLADASDILSHITHGPQILIGSSMGGWLALLLARLYPQRIAGFVGIAAAPDFTERLIKPALTEAQWQDLHEKGFTTDPEAPPDMQLPVTHKFLDEAQKHLIFSRPLQVAFPVHLLQGLRDKEVPWQMALHIVEHCTNTRENLTTSANVRVTMVKDGDHRLSRAEDLALLQNVLDLMLNEKNPAG